MQNVFLAGAILVLVPLLARSETLDAPTNTDESTVSPDGKHLSADDPVCKSGDCNKKSRKSATSETLPLQPVTVTEKRVTPPTAQEIKQEKLEIVDSVTAEEIHKLPDISVGEAMQRISGVQIARDRGEGATISIRGLTQVETLLNGREVFTAGSGRTLNFADIPSELVSSINVYKTSSAEHIEGGVGGMVDLRTHRPFDFDGKKIVLSGRLVRSDFVDETAPQFSLLASNRWETSGQGELGILVDLAYQKRGWREDEKNMGTPKLQTLGGQSVVAPNGTTENTSVGDRERIGGNVVLEWRPTEALDLYAEANYSRFKTWQDTYQLFVTPGTFNSMTLFPGTHDIQSITWANAPVGINTFARDTVDDTKQVAVGGSWTHQAFTLKTDLSYTKSFNTLFFNGFVMGTAAPSFTQDLSGNIPSVGISGVNLLDPNNLTATRYLYRTSRIQGDLSAARIDGEYQFQDGFMETVSAGLRYAKRHADNGVGTVLGDVNGLSIAATSLPGLIHTDPYNFFGGDTASIRNFLVGRMSSVRDVAELRRILGITSGVTLTTNKATEWDISEETGSGYLMGQFKGTNIPLDGNFGLRVVRTQENVSGFETVPSSSTTKPLSVDKTYTDYLPSINLRYELQRGLYLRGAASKTVTRPDFNQLSPSASLAPLNFTGSGGNPNLRAIRAKNLDLAIEKYINKSTYAYLTSFVKEVDGFILNVNRLEEHDGNPYLINRPENSNTTHIRGFEVGYQQIYDFLPGWLSGLGLQANYTYIDSDLAKVGDVVLPLQFLSKQSYNLIGMYEKGDISARLAYNWRSKYSSGSTTILNTSIQTPIYVKSYGWLDASVSYRLTDKVTLAIEGSNLLGTIRKSYYGVETRPQSAWMNDRQISAVVTVNF